MTEKVSTMDVRQRIGDMLNRVALRHDEFIIQRKGKPLAALVPVVRLEQMRSVARQGLRELLTTQGERARAEPSDVEAMSVALAAQRAARRKGGKLRAKRKKS
jgi:prevent-host-death family protein